MTIIVSPTKKNIKKCADALRAGRLVAFGTETVYGLGGDATSTQAITSIFRVKNRPSHNPLICHVPSLKEAEKYVYFNTLSRRLAQTFWPGPMTLVLPKREDCHISPQATNNLPSIAIRIPNDDVALSLLKEANLPIVAPSANLSGKISPTTAQDVYHDLGDHIEFIIDTGPCDIGIESTVIDLTDDNHPIILRPGGITREELQEFCPHIDLVTQQSKQNTTSPGLSKSHYAPSLKMRLNAHCIKPDEVLLAFGPPLSGAKIMFNLSLKKDLDQAASHLYEALHVLDKKGQALGLHTIAAQPIPNIGIGRAINDRLRRAAAPRTTHAYQNHNSLSSSEEQSDIEV